MTRHAQEHGDWPRAIMLDLWGSATIRTGGEDFAQALALLGVIPLWDNATARVIGFEIEPMAKRDFPRVDVTLHISGLFRDMFPGLIALFHDAVGAVAALDEEAERQSADAISRRSARANFRRRAGRLRTWPWRNDFARLLDDARGFGRGFSRRGRSRL